MERFKKKHINHKNKQKIKKNKIKKSLKSLLFISNFKS